MKALTRLYVFRQGYYLHSYPNNFRIFPISQHFLKLYIYYLRRIRFDSETTSFAINC